MRTAWSRNPVPASRLSCQTTRIGHHGTLAEPWGNRPYVDITFLDTNRVRWHLDSRAVLKRLRSDPAV
jgi:hypothetical protein